MLYLSGSKELDVVSMDPGDVVDSPPHTPAYEELIEVITCAVARLNIEWPAKRQEVCQRSLLDEIFLPSRTQPPRRGLPFFPDLHTEVSKSWNKPVSYRVFFSCNFQLLLYVRRQKLWLWGNV